MEQTIGIREVLKAIEKLNGRLDGIDGRLDGLQAGLRDVKTELQEFREDMGGRLGKQWETNRAIERHLRTLTEDRGLSLLQKEVGG